MAYLKSEKYMGKLIRFKVGLSWKKGDPKHSHRVIIALTSDEKAVLSIARTKEKAFAEAKEMIKRGEVGVILRE